MSGIIKFVKVMAFIIFLSLFIPAHAQTAKDEAQLKKRLREYFENYKPKHNKMRKSPRLVSVQTSKTDRTMAITADS